MQSAASTNTVPIAMLATTATVMFEATVLEVDTALMALAGWLLLGSRAQLARPLWAPEVTMKCGQVLTKTVKWEL